MADRNIDQEEIKYYGPFAARIIRKRVVGLVPAFDPGLDYVADQIDGATAAVAQAVEAARDKDAETRLGTRQKKPLLKQAQSLLGRFSRHLSAHAAGSVDRKIFFVADGTAGGVGKSAPQVLLAVSHIAGKLKQPATKINDKATWAKDFSDMMTALGPVVEFADDARSDRRDITPEVEAARQAWMQVYLSARSVVEGVLRLSGKLRRLSTVFYDLAVPASTKLTAPPPEPPEEPEVNDEGDENEGEGEPKQA